MLDARLSLAIALLSLSAATGASQTSQPSRQGTIAETVDSWIGNTEQHLVPLADALPASKYAFAPPSRFGEFEGVRSFGDQVKHLAANNYRAAALILGETPSGDMSDERGPDSVRTKAQIMRYLKGSFAALHHAVGSIEPANVTAPVATSSAWQRNRLSFAIDAIAHSFDHYGQMVEYARMNGIIPPDSRPRSP
ncbi:MAG TPA: DinB family protein [Gemmatimonadaceae bacterium]|nr:DinB family protein [Gemmatimonadaceae bacterium]